MNSVIEFSREESSVLYAWAEGLGPPTASHAFDDGVVQISHCWNYFKLLAPDNGSTLSSSTLIRAFLASLGS
jgi:hypothetical protein